MNRMQIDDSVAEALSEGRAVVALESTIIAHGFPYPRNLEVARALEAEVRQEGAIPATIAVLDGIIRVGLTEDELKRLAEDSSVLKASTRDLAYATTQGLSAATTVSATMVIAERAGIFTFATGGIGGVHLGANETFDISRDLETLADTSVAVVCAGAKAILDLPLTMEYLETKGVEVIGYQTDELPAFYSRESRLAVPLRLDTPAAIARLMQQKRNLHLPGGMVIANPIPRSAALDKSYIDGIIEKALEDARHRGVQGKALTPALLSAIEKKTGGKSLEANLALARNNAYLAARIAKEHAALR